MKGNQLSMKFNPGTKKFEFELPLRKSNKKEKIIEFKWKEIILVLIVALIVFGIYLIVNRFFN